MRSRSLPFFVLFAMLVVAFLPLRSWTAPAAADEVDPAVVEAAEATITPTFSISLTPLGTYRTGVFDEGAQEIAAYDPVSQTLFVINAQAVTIDIIDISDPMSPTLQTQIDASAYGASANSVAVRDDIIAVAIEADPQQDNGSVVFFDRDGTVLNQVEVGALPDMVTISPDGNYVMTANEGQPNDDYTVDPEGSVSIIDVSGGVENATVNTLGFTQFNDATLDPSIRIYGPDATVAQDLEPEYIAVSPDSAMAWVTLQENNALGVIDMEAMTVTQLVGLGFKDHNLPGNGLDASDRDGTINITNWPVRGLYENCSRWMGIIVAPNSLAISTVPSVEPESTTITSWVCSVWD